MNIFSRVTTALAAAAIGALALVGCDEQKIKELEEGLSTEADVRDRFGVPDMSGTKAAVRTRWNTTASPLVPRIT